jgi:hypothetical protein
MTSLAFILGVVPLVIASGASAASQQAFGTGVLGDMITATVLAVFWVPVFFLVVMRLFTRQKPDAASSNNMASAAPSRRDDTERNVCGFRPGKIALVTEWQYNPILLRLPTLHSRRPD